MWTTSSLLSRLDELIRLQRETNQLLREQILTSTKQPARTPLSDQKRRMYTAEDVGRTGDAVGVRSGTEDATKSSPTKSSPTASLSTP